MELIGIYLLTQLLLLIVLIFASIGDIQHRKLLPIVPLALMLLISIPVNTQIGDSIPGIGVWMGINAGVTILITAALYGVNIWRALKDKPRLVGGGDIITYATISLVFPVSILGFTGIWIILASIIIAGIAGLIPKIDKSHKERGHPHIVYLSIAYAAGVLLQTAGIYII